MKPSAPYLGLILASVGKLQAFLNRGCRMSPLTAVTEDEDEDLNENIPTF